MDTALKIGKISKHQYYYIAPVKASLKNNSTYTKKLENKIVSIISNTEVVKEIEQIQTDPDTNYGYRKMNYALQQIGFLINHKKVYRLMQENDLLKDCVKQKQSQNAVLLTVKLLTLENARKRHFTRLIAVLSYAEASNRLIY